MTTKTSTASLAAVNIGTVFYSSWGYEQTNIDFYVVTKRTASTVTLQKVKAIEVESGGMVGKVIAGSDPVGKPFSRKLKGDAVSIDSYTGAWVWDGKPKFYSTYA